MLVRFLNHWAMTETPLLPFDLLGILSKSSNCQHEAVFTLSISALYFCYTVNSITLCPLPQPWGHHDILLLILSFFFFFVFLPFLGLLPRAYGGSQARGPVRAAATGFTRVTTTWDPSCICNLHPQLTAMSDPQPTEQGQGSNLQPHRS